MSKAILLAVDANHTSAATDMARDLAKGSGDRVVVLHVHEFAVGRFGRVQVDCADGEGERVVSDAVQSLRGSGVDATEDVRKTHVGHIARTILDTSEEVGAWVIVLGSSGAHDVPRLPFGSVSLRLLHLSDKPVLIVPRSVSAGGAAEPAAAVTAN
jgi:nucleotide-binding universal stress UspA family protein